MKTIKTGATIYLEEWNAYHKCDVWLLDNFEGLIFRVANKRLESPVDPEEVHFNVGRIDQWFDQHASHGTLFVQKRRLDTNPAFRKFYADQGYHS